MIKLYRFAFVMLAAFMLFLGASPGQAVARGLDEIMKSGEIRIGINPRIPPLAYLGPKNTPIGFEVDLAEEIAKRLGVKLTIVPADSNERIPYVVTGRIDAVMGYLTRTTDRAKVIDFTFPINTATYGVITKEEFGFKSLSDLNKDSVTIVMARGTAILPQVQAALPMAKFLILDSLPDTRRAFVQGRGQAIVNLIDTAHVSIVAANPGIKFNIFPTPELPAHMAGIGVAKGNDSLRRWLNVMIYELHSEGFIRETWKKHFGREMWVYPPYTPFF